MTSYEEVWSEELTPTAISSFWKKIESLGIAGVGVDISSETGSVTATNIEWSTTGQGPIGVRFSIYRTMTELEKVGKSAESDEEYEIGVNQLLVPMIQEIKALIPSSLDASFTIDKGDV